MDAAGICGFKLNFTCVVGDFGFGVVWVCGCLWFWLMGGVVLFRLVQLLVGLLLAGLR